MIFGYDCETNSAFFSHDGRQLSLSAPTAKEAWRAAWRWYREQQRPIPYLKLQFAEV